LDSKKLYDSTQVKGESYSALALIKSSVVAVPEDLPPNNMFRRMAEVMPGNSGKLASSCVSRANEGSLVV
jgi:hypothetical protein